MSENTTVEVGGKTYQVVKTGRAHAEQVVLLTKWIKKHGVPAATALQQSGLTDKATNNIEFLLGAIDVLTADALIDLFVVATGCSQEEAEIYFDVATLIDAVIAVYQHTPAIQRLLDRFFLVSGTEEKQEESSTTSEEPTDGQTTKS